MGWGYIKIDWTLSHNDKKGYTDGERQYIRV